MNEANPFNNAATKVIRVGNPIARLEIVWPNLSVPSPLYVGQAAMVRAEGLIIVEVEGVRTTSGGRWEGRVDIIPQLVYNGALSMCSATPFRDLDAPSATGPTMSS